AAPGVAGLPADADLHRSGRAKGVRPAAHTRQRGPPVVAFHGADAGKQRPRHAVLLPDDPVPVQVVGGDGVLRVRIGRDLAGDPGLLARASRALREEHVGADQDRHGQQTQQQHAGQSGDREQHDPGCSALPGSGAFRPPLQEPGTGTGVHVLPREASSMSLTCQLAPLPVSVTAYFWLPLLVPCEVVIRCAMFTMNTRLDCPNPRSDSIVAVAVATCCWLVRSCATPGVVYAFCRVAASWPVISPFIFAR